MSFLSSSSWVFTGSWFRVGECSFKHNRRDNRCYGTVTARSVRNHTQTHINIQALHTPRRFHLCARGRFHLCVISDATCEETETLQVRSRALSFHPRRRYEARCIALGSSSSRSRRLHVAGRPPRENLAGVKASRADDWFWQHRAGARPVKRPKYGSPIRQAGVLYAT